MVISALVCLYNAKIPQFSTPKKFQGTAGKTLKAGTTVSLVCCSDFLIRCIVLVSLQGEELLRVSPDDPPAPQPDPV